MADEEEFSLESEISSAIGKYIGGYATEFVLVFHAIDADGDLKEQVVVQEDQFLTTTAGLLHYANIQTDMLFRRGLQQQMDEED
jgi:hypothetical protein